MYSRTFIDFEWAHHVTGEQIMQGIEGLLGVGALLTLLAPFWMLFKTRGLDAADGARRRARTRAACSLFVAAVVGVGYAGWSFSVHALNMLAASGALVADFLLVRYVFSLVPRAAGITIGLVSGALWCLALLGTLLTLPSHVESPVWVGLGDGLRCSETYFGILTTDADFYLELQSHYGFVDHRLYERSLKENAMGTAPPVPPGLAEPLARCETLLEQQRRSQ